MPRFDPEEAARRDSEWLEKRKYYGAHPPGKRYGRREGLPSGWWIGPGAVLVLAVWGAIAVWVLS